MNKIQDRTQELKKSVVQSILLCLSCYFYVYVDKQVHKNVFFLIQQAKKKK